MVVLIKVSAHCRKWPCGKYFRQTVTYFCSQLKFYLQGKFEINFLHQFKSSFIFNIGRKSCNSEVLFILNLRVQLRPKFANFKFLQVYLAVAGNLKIFKKIVFVLFNLVNLVFYMVTKIFKFELQYRTPCIS